MVLVLLMAQLFGSLAGEPPVQPGMAPDAGRSDPPVSFRGVPQRCADPAGEVIPADRVMADLRDGKDVVLKGRVIEGSLHGETIASSPEGEVTSLRVVPGKLRLESCRVQGSLSFRRCVLAQGLEFPCTEVRGDIDLTGSYVPGSLQAPRARLSGDLRLGEVTIGGDLLLEDATIGGRFELSSGRVSGRLAIDAGRFRGGVEIRRALLGGLSMDDARFERPTVVRDILVLSELSAGEALFQRGVLFESVRIDGSADLSEAAGPEGIVLRDLRVGTDLDLALATRGTLEIAGLQVGQDLSFWDGRFGPVTIDRAVVRRGTELEDARFRGNVVIRDSDFGEVFTADAARFLGECEFRSVRFPGESPMEGAYFANPPALIDTRLPLDSSSWDEEYAGEEFDEDDDDGGL
jgi:hypothetical protein